MGEDNYIGSHKGKLGQDLEGNLLMEDFELNKLIEGYLYLDAEKRDAYRIKYDDSATEFGYWDVKITK